MSEKLEALLQAVIDAETDTSYHYASESLAEAAPQILALIKARTPAPEGEVVPFGWAWRDADSQPWRFSANEPHADLEWSQVHPLYASPVVPAPEGEACWPHSYETDAAGQAIRCVDCGMSFASEASPVVPVGVSRETLLKAVRPVLDRHPMIDSSQSHKLDIQAGWVVDAILAALRPTDTGGQP